MKQLKIKTARGSIIIFIVLLLSIGCTPLIARYDQYSYQEAISLKVDAVNLIASATDSISKHLLEVNAVNTRIEKLYEYEKGKPNNTITTQQWEILKNPDRNLYGGFIKEWKNNGKLKPVYVSDKQDQIGKAFDVIIKLEAHKIRERKIN